MQIPMEGSRLRGKEEKKFKTNFNMPIKNIHLNFYN